MKTKSNKTATLNDEAITILMVISKHDKLGASEIKTKLRWNFIPSRGLTTLKDGKYVSMDDKKKYSILAKGIAALKK